MLGNLFRCVSICSRRLLVMNRESEAELLNFCVRQHKSFKADSWMQRPERDRQELAAVALFLAGVDWFPHRQHLLEIAERLHGGYVGRFSELAKLVRFDCSRFSNLLRRELTLAKHAHVSS